MKRCRFEEMHGGWFVGDFAPAAFRTSAAEVCFKTHHKGEVWPTHYHAIATEINLITSGTMRINGELLEAGEIFLIEPGEVATPEFLTNCTLVIVKVPSVPNDKYIV